MNVLSLSLREEKKEYGYWRDSIRANKRVLQKNRFPDGYIIYIKFKSV